MECVIMFEADAMQVCYAHVSDERLGEEGVSCRPTRVTSVPSFRVTMSLRKVRGNFERLFDKSLTDLVRGIRNNRDNEVSKSRGTSRSF